MSKRNFPPIYTKFDGLFREHSHPFLRKVAIWHVPDPKQLHCKPQCNGTAETTGRYIQQHPESGLRSIGFGELRGAVVDVACQIRLRLQRHCKMQIKNEGVQAEDMVQADTIIAILMPPGIERIVAQIACMALKLAYLPLDRQLSVGRLIDLMNRVDPVMVVTSRDYYQSIFEESLDVSSKPATGRLETLRDMIKRSRIEIIEDLLEHPNMDSDGCYADPEGRQTARNDSHDLFLKVQDPVVIVLSTSGSTAGGPKLVQLRNSQLMNRLRWQWSSQMTISENGDWNKDYSADLSRNTDVALASTAVVFVDAFTELFGSLFAGFTVVVPGNTNCASEVCVSDVRVLSDLVRAFQITHLTTVPNQLKSWMNQMELIKTPALTQSLDSLRTVVISGDILLPELACQFFRKFAASKVRLINLYGTTEVAGDITAAVFDGLADVKTATRHAIPNNPSNPVMEVVPFLSVGQPIPNTTIFVVQKTQASESLAKRRLDKEGSLALLGQCTDTIDWASFGYELCPMGSVGEVVVSGVPVGATGMIFRDRERRISSVDAPRNSQIYFPGDLGFVCPQDNRLYICGRSDELVKINAVGFLANEVDRILSRIKEECTNNPDQLSDTERKFSKIRESVTLPCQHPIQQECHLVCFYVLDPISLHNVSEGQEWSPSTTKDLVKAKTELMVELPGTYESCEQYPRPCELSSAMAYYLPVYIRPVFIRVNGLPIMSTSGKIDKELLKSAYQEFIIHGQRGDRSETDDPATIRPRSISQVIVNVDLPWNKDPREQSRELLAKILGIQCELGKAVDQRRPRDDEDFYFLGGNSLTAVLALESLRQLGFKVGLEIFYHDGNIGRILDSLASSVIATEKGKYLNPFPRTLETTPTHPRRTGESISVRQWNALPDPNAHHQPTREQIIQLLVEEFGKRDPISHAFELKWTDLELAASTYFKTGEDGIVLTAMYQKMDGGHVEEENLVGVLLSVSTSNLPDLPETESLSKLQSFFNYVATVEEPTEGDSLPESSLTVCMAGIRAPYPEQETETLHTNRAKWNRVTMEILASLEEELLRVARRSRYTIVETINTNEATKEVCSELGYVTIKTSKMLEFSCDQGITIDSRFHDLQSYYMIKRM